MNQLIRYFSVFIFALCVYSQSATALESWGVWINPGYGCELSLGFDNQSQRLIVMASETQPNPNRRRRSRRIRDRRCNIVGEVLQLNCSRNGQCIEESDANNWAQASFYYFGYGYSQVELSFMKSGLLYRPERYTLRVEGTSGPWSFFN